MKQLIRLASLALLLFVPLVSSQAQTPPEELGLSSHYVTLSTGINMHYVEKGKGKGHVIIFLHGYTDSWRSFERNLPLISDKFHVYALDQRGHGDSSRPASGYTQAGFAADVNAFMGAMKIKKATIVGHSMGAFIAHKVAIDYPSRVERLVLVGGAPHSNSPVAADLNSYVQTLTDPIDEFFVRDFQQSTFAGENGVSEEFLTTAVSESLKLPASVWRQVFAGLLAEDHTSQLSQIQAPTLILYGDRDGIFSYQDQITLDTLIPDSTFKYYYRDEQTGVGHPGHTGHGLHVEWPHHFVGDLEAFAK